MSILQLSTECIGTIDKMFRKFWWVNLRKKGNFTPSSGVTYASQWKRVVRGLGTLRKIVMYYRQNHVRDVCPWVCMLLATNSYALTQQMAMPELAAWYLQEWLSWAPQAYTTFGPIWILLRLAFDKEEDAPSLNP